MVAARHPVQQRDSGEGAGGAGRLLRGGLYGRFCGEGVDYYDFKVHRPVEREGLTAYAGYREGMLANVAVIHLGERAADGTAQSEPRKVLLKNLDDGVKRVRVKKLAAAGRSETTEGIN